MLYWWGFLVAAVVSATGEDIKLEDKWVKFVPPRNVRSGELAWSLKADSGSTIKVFCPDWRFSGYDVDEKTCQSRTPLEGAIRVVFDDGLERRSFCNSQSNLLVNGKTSRMSIQLTVPPRSLGAIECMAKAIRPPKSYEEVTVTYGRGAVSFKWPETPGQEQEKAWRLRSDSNKKISLQCKVRSSRAERNGVCVKEIITLDNGEGPKQRCDYYDFVSISAGTQITLRAELFGGSPSQVDCLVQAISGPSPKEHENVGPPPDDDSSEIGVVPGRKGTTCDCGRTNRQSSRIINGTEVSHEGKFPFMVSLSSGGSSCGASILSPVHILTAAHCVSYSGTKPLPVPSVITATVGGHAQSKESSHGQQQSLKVKKVSIPDKWFKVNHSLSSDIAILHLETPIRFSKWVGPVCLSPEEPPIVNQYIKAIGWGVSEKTRYPDILREADVLVLDSALCHNNKKEICFRAGRTSSCNGDSGGPYLWADPETNRYTQVALVSYGEVGTSDNPFACDGDRFAGTSTAYWYDWIQKTMAETSTEHTICRKRD